MSELKTFAYVEPSSGIVIEISLPPEMGLDPLELDTDAIDGPEDDDGRRLIASEDGRVIALPPGRYTLEPITHSPFRWRWFHVEGDKDERRVFDKKLRPVVDELEDDVLLRLESGDLVWESLAGDVEKHEAVVERLVPRPPYAQAPVVIGPTNYAISHGESGSPFAKSLPRRNVSEGTRDVLDGRDVVKYSDGGVSNLQGQPAIRNKRDYESERARTGMERD